MEGIELISFQIISAVGSAKSLYIEAIQEAKKGNFSEAEGLMEAGTKVYLDGHRAHSSLIHQEARGEKIELALLLMHAEDQLMATDTIKIIAQELIELHKNTLGRLKNEN